MLVAQSCPTLCDPMDCSPPGSSLHEIFQARILKWVAISFSRGSSQPRDQTWVSCTAGRFFTDWATREDIVSDNRLLSWLWTSLIAQLVKNRPAVQETWVRSLGWEDPLKKGMATHSRILAWTPMNRGAWWATVHGVTKSWTRLSDNTFTFLNTVKLSQIQSKPEGVLLNSF